MGGNRAFPLILVAGLAALAPPSSQSARGPMRHEDASDIAGGPLALTGGSIDQQGTHLEMRITTAGDWDAGDLSQRAGRTLCIKLFRGHATQARARICVVARRHGTGLRFTRVTPGGHPVEVRPFASVVDRPDARTIDATFAPGDVELRLGEFSWQAESRWRDTAACRQTCTNRLPDRGDIVGRIVPVVEPACFGAAARDYEHPCSNPALKRTVVPAPADAVIQTNAPCTLIEQRGVLLACTFGARPSQAAGTIALIGDSHASHLRAALDVVALAKGWRGVSITRASCPFTRAATADVVTPTARARCARWKRDVSRWLSKHRSVRTVFVSADAYSHVIGPGGSDSFAARVTGYIAAWKSMPRSVRHVIVVRDVPQNDWSTMGCVQRAIAKHRPAGPACAVPRAAALVSDPELAAAAKLHSRRIQVIDLTRYMCGPQECYPVIGGALVHKDTHHLTQVFATTLGPFLLRRLDQIMASW